MFSFDVQNEAQIGSPRDSVLADWSCDRATKIRSLLTDPHILVTDGGVGPVKDGDSTDYRMFDSNVRCPKIDVVTVHSYDGPDKINDAVQRTKGLAANKRIIVQGQTHTQTKMEACTLRRMLVPMASD